MASAPGHAAPDVPQPPLVAAARRPAWDRLFPMWDAYFAVVTIAVGAGVATDGALTPPRRLIATAAILLAITLYATIGRRRVRYDRPGRGTLLFVIAEAVLFAVAELCADNTGFLLFALTPLIFLSLALRAAVPIVVIVNLVPTAAGLIRDGFSVSRLAHLGTISVITAGFALFIGFWIDRVVEQSKERGALIAELEASRAEVARLSHEAGVAAERARLAGEIHDTLARCCRPPTRRSPTSGSRWPYARPGRI